MYPLKQMENMGLQELCILWIRIIHPTLNMVYSFYICFGLLLRMASRFSVVLPMSVDCVRSVDLVKCDLSAVDVIAQIDGTIRSLRMLLTKDGTDAFNDPAHPFVQFNIKCKENGVVFETALLIQKGNCYSYSFFANNSWRNTSDSPYTLTDTEDREIIKEKFSSDYSSEDVDKVGLCNLVRAVQSLSSNNRRIWKKWFLHLVHVFIESARLLPMESMARASFLFHVDDCIDCTHTDKILHGMTRAEVINEICEDCRDRLFNLSVTPLDTISDLAYRYRNSWGSLSEALKDNGPRWSLCQATAALLGLPKDESDQKLLVKEYVRIVKIPARQQLQQQQ